MVSEAVEKSRMRIGLKPRSSAWKRGPETLVMVEAKLEEGIGVELAGRLLVAH